MRRGTARTPRATGGTIASWSSGRLHVASGFRGAEQGGACRRLAFSRGPLDVQVAAAAVLLVAALIGALAGSAGYALFVERHQNRRVAALAEHLTEAQDEGELIAIDAGRIRATGCAGLPSSPTGWPTPGARDDRPADRHRQPPAVLDPCRRGARAGDPLPPPAVADPRRPRPLQAPQRLPRPRAATRSCASRAAARRERPRRRHRRPVRRRGVPDRAARDRRRRRGVTGREAAADRRRPRCG